MVSDGVGFGTKGGRGEGLRGRGFRDFNGWRAGDHGRINYVVILAPRAPLEEDIAANPFRELGILDVLGINCWWSRCFDAT